MKIQFPSVNYWKVIKLAKNKNLKPPVAELNKNKVFTFAERKRIDLQNEQLCY